MDYRALGDTGIEVSSIGLGCVTFGREIAPGHAFSILDFALGHGITLLDTAEAYGQGASERAVGEWLRQSSARESVVLATKVRPPLTPEHIAESARKSLGRLGISCVDLFLVHAWDADTPLDETLGALSRLVDEGFTRSVGCSNFTMEQLRQANEHATRLALHPLRSVQPIYNLVHRGIEDDLLPYCSRAAVGVITYSPLGAGFLTGKYERGQPVPKGTRFDVIPGHQNAYFTESGFAGLERLRSAADEAGVSITDAALSWAFRREDISSVLVGARSVGHIEQALRADRVEPVPSLLSPDTSA